MEKITVVIGAAVAALVLRLAAAVAPAVISGAGR
jgi:hypothetical protein